MNIFIFLKNVNMKVIIWVNMNMNKFSLQMNVPKTRHNSGSKIK